MEIQGKFTIKAPQQKVWDFVRNPVNAQPCIPGCLNIEEVSEGTYKSTIGVKLGPIAPSFNLTIKITEEKAPDYISLAISGQEGGKASSVRATSIFRLNAISDAVTEVEYFSESEIVGRLGKYGSGIIKKKASQIWEEVADRLRVELEGGQANASQASGKNDAPGVFRVWWIAGAFLVVGIVVALNI